MYLPYLPVGSYVSGYNFLAFDIIGDLAFGSPFGMLKAGRDSAAVLLPGSSTMQYLPAVEILNYRGTYSASLGVVPPWARCVLDVRSGAKRESS
jgi:benzoate 4-monooxygenase